MSTRTVEAAGARIHVVDEGDPAHPPVVLLHAGIADLTTWDELVPLLVEAGYRVVRYDARGFGRTVTEAVEYSNRADVLAVMDALGIGRAALVGNSRGGNIALDTALESPDRVVAVVGVAAGIGGYEGELTADELAAFERVDALETAIDEAGDAVDPAMIDELVEDEMRIWVDGLGQPADRVDPAIRERVRAADRTAYDPTRVQGRPIPLQPPAVERLRELRAPMLAVTGEFDFSEMAQAARHLVATVPGARHVELPGIAHMLGMEAPERLAALIVEHLAPLPRWS